MEISVCLSAELVKWNSEMSLLILEVRAVEHNWEKHSGWKELVTDWGENIAVLSWKIVVVYTMSTLHLFLHLLLYLWKDKVFPFAYWIWITVMNFLQQRNAVKLKILKNSTTNIESGRKHLPCDRELQLVPQYQIVSSGTMHTSNVLQTDQVVCRPIHIHVHIHVCI